MLIGARRQGEGGAVMQVRCGAPVARQDLLHLLGQAQPLILKQVCVRVSACVCVFTCARAHVCVCVCLSIK